MQNALDFGGQKVRHVTVGGRPWFVAADVLRQLYPNFNANSGATTYLTGMNHSHRRLVSKFEPPYTALFEGHPHTPSLSIISEDAVRTLVTRARRTSPQAAAIFQHRLSRSKGPLASAALPVPMETPQKDAGPLADLMTFKGQEVRHAMIGGGPWFVASDVCRCLGMRPDRMSDYRHALADDEYQTVTRRPGSFGCLFRNTEPRLALISESGLYKLIMRAQRIRPEVAEFQDWVTRVVLPAIRKTGGYLLNEEARPTALADQREELPVPANLAEALRAYADEVERREAAERMAVPASLSQIRFGVSGELLL